MEKYIIRSKAKQNSLHDALYYINIKSLSVSDTGTLYGMSINYAVLLVIYQILMHGYDTKYKKGWSCFERIYHLAS